MNDPTQANRLSNKLLNFVFRFGHHQPLAIHSSKSLYECAEHRNPSHGKEKIHIIHTHNIFDLKMIYFILFFIRLN